MFPILFKLGPLAIGTHDAFVFAGVFAALALVLRDASRARVLDERLAWVIIGSLVTGAIAAKLSTVWQYVAFAPDVSLRGAILFGGKSILGGLTGAYAGAVVTKRLVGLTMRTGDLFAPAVALGMAVGRVGCLLTEQLGTPTTWPWGISVTADIAARIPMCASCAAGVPMHPSFLYEILFQVAACLALLWLAPRVPVRGELFKLYLLWYAVFRFFVEFVRGNTQVLFGLSWSQLFLVPAILVLAGYFVRQAARGVYQVPSLSTMPPVMDVETPHVR